MAVTNQWHLLLESITGNQHSLHVKAGITDVAQAYWKGGSRTENI